MKKGSERGCGSEGPRGCSICAGHVCDMKTFEIFPEGLGDFLAAKSSQPIVVKGLRKTLINQALHSGR